MKEYWKKFFGGFGFGDLLNFGGGLTGSLLNYFGQKSANKSNERIAQAANEAQAAESEKAYQRSKAGNQVGLMQQAGMSRAGAINALDGGGSYTPAAVNTAQVEAPQLDMSFLASMASNVTQARTAEDNIKAQAAAQDKQIKAQADIEQARLDFEREKWEFEQDMRIKQEARAQYNQDLQNLNVEMRNAASAVERLADPADYDTPAAYRAAIYDKATEEQRKYFDNSEFTNVLDLYHAANASAKNVAANTNYTNKQSAFTEAQTKELKAHFDEWKNEKDVRIKELKGRDLLSDFKNMALEMGIADEEYQRSLHYVFDENGKLKVGNWDKVDSSVARFWQSLFTIIPVDVVAEVLKFLL